MVNDRIGAECHMRRRSCTSQPVGHVSRIFNRKIISRTEFSLDSKRFKVCFLHSRNFSFSKKEENHVTTFSLEPEQRATEQTATCLLGRRDSAFWLLFCLSLAKCFMNLWKKGAKLLFCYLYGGIVRH